MKVSNVFNRLVFGLTTIFWTAIITVLNVFFFQNTTVGIALDIMLMIANIIFLETLLSSWKSYMHNTKYTEKKQKETYEKIVELKTRNEVVKELVKITGLPTPISYKKKRIKMTIITIIGCCSCALSIFTVLAPYFD